MPSPSGRRTADYHAATSTRLTTCSAGAARTRSTAPAATTCCGATATLPDDGFRATDVLRGGPGRDTIYDGRGTIGCGCGFDTVFTGQKLRGCERVVNRFTAKRRGTLGQRAV